MRPLMRVQTLNPLCLFRSTLTDKARKSPSLLCQNTKNDIVVDVIYWTLESDGSGIDVDGIALNAVNI